MNKQSFLAKWGWLVVVGVGILLRLPLLSGSFWLDEAAQALESSRSWSQQFAIIPDFQPPLLHLIVHVAQYVSHAEWWLRVWGALLPGVLSIYLGFKIAEKLAGTKAAWWSALLLATSSFHIFYSQELRQYSLPTFWAMLSWWWWVKLGSSKKVPATHWWWQWAAIGVAGMYSSYLYPFLLATQLGYMWLSRPTWRRTIMISTAGMALVMIPWLPIFRLQLAAGGEVQAQLPGWSGVVSVPQLKSLPLVVVKFVFGVLDVEPTWPFVLSLAGIGAWLSWLGWQLREGTRWSWDHPLVLASIWLFIPVLAAWLISFVIPVLQPKRVLFALPAWYLAVSWLGTQTKTKLGSIGLGLLLTINLWGTLAYYQLPQYQREDWRAVHAWVTERYPATKSVAVFAFPEAFAPWRWYDDGTYPVLATGHLHVDQVADLAEALKPVTESEYVVTFDYLSDLSDPERKVWQVLRNLGYSEVEIQSWPGVGFVRVWSKQSGRISSSW